jgi:hypothetical protein
VTTTTEGKANATTSTTTEQGKSTANTGVPDKYEFKPPAGQTYDQPLLDAATPIFRELGLSQPQADRLVELWNKHAQSQADVGAKAIVAQGEKWMTETKADPDVGPKLDQIKADIGSAFNAMIAKGTITERDRTEFMQSMDLSMVGSQRAFIKIFGAMAKAHVEGKAVSGTGPSAEGQHPNGKAAPLSIAAAMYPNLPRQN